MYLTQALRRSAARRPSATALICGERHYSWQQFQERCARLAAGLVALGLARGDRVAFLGHNSEHYFEYSFAVPWAGGIIVPLNNRLAVAELAFILDDAGAGILIVDDNFAASADQLREICPGLRELLYFQPGAVDSPYEALIAGNSPLDDQLRGYEDVAGILYTSGTTGKPKGAALSHRNLICNALGSLHSYGFNESTRYLHATPLFHAAGASRVYTMVTAGTTNIILPKFDVPRLLATIARHRITHLLLVPTMINRLAHHPDVREHDLSSLECISYGASPMPRAVLEAAIANLPGVRFNQAYGMTELSPAATFLDSAYHVLDGPDAGRLASCGRPVLFADVRIVDDRDQPLPDDAVGEIVVRGPMVMQGYWNNPQATAEAVRDGWMHTGDAGYRDEQGFFYIVDRIKDLVITGGENVSSVEVENCIHQLAEVGECAVFGIPDDDWVEAVHAVVVPKAGQTLTEATVIAHCKAQLTSYKCPRSVDIRLAALPLSGTGKIMKNELRKPFWAGRTRQV